MIALISFFLVFNIFIYLFFLNFLAICVSIGYSLYLLGGGPGGGGGHGGGGPGGGTLGLIFIGNFAIALCN